MSGSSSIRASLAIVEIALRDKVTPALDRVSRKLKAFGATTTALGSSLLKVGTGAASPFIAATMAAAGFEQGLADLRAGANPTADDLKRLREAALTLSKDLKVDPTAIVTAFTELLKAGMSVETVLGDAGKAAVQFATVGGLDAAKAATVMADAMTVFGTDAEKTINTLSSAADASSIGIEQVAESFSMASAVFGLGKQSLKDLSTSIAILGNNGLKGSDAGTSLKTMLLALMAPTETGAKAMERLALNVRGANGELLPMPQIIEKLSAAFDGLAPDKRDAEMKDLFGTDGLRAGAILLKAGADGFRKFGRSMDESLTVSAKFDAMTDTLKGKWEGFHAALMRVGITLGDVVSGSLVDLLDKLQSGIEWLGQFISKHQELFKVLGLASAAIALLGAGLVAVGTVFTATSTVAATLVAILTAMVAHPLIAVMTAWAAVIAVVSTKCALSAASAREMSTAIAQLTAASDKQRAAELSKLDRLVELAAKEKLTNDEMSEAEGIINSLSGQYGDLNVVLDKTTNSLHGVADAQRAVTEAMRAKAADDVKREIAEVQANIAKLRGNIDDQTTAWAGFWQAMFGGDNAGKVKGFGKQMEAEMEKFRGLHDRLAALQNGDVGAIANNAAPPKAGAKPAPALAAPAVDAVDDVADAEEKLAEITEQAADQRMSALDRELKEIRKQYAERTALIDRLMKKELARPKGARTERIRELAQKQKNADQEMKDDEAEANRKDEEHKNKAKREIEFDIEKAEIDAGKMTARNKEKALLEAERRKELEDAKENGLDPDLINKKFDLQQKAVDLKHDKLDKDKTVSTSRGTFSAAAAARFGGASDPAGRTAKATEKTAAAVEKMNKINEDLLREVRQNQAKFGN